jgi:glycerophosphoryl diester phosphodiesterase
MLVSASISGLGQSAMDDPRSLFTPESVRGPCGLIAHALGGIDGLAYLNCREGFLATCRAGYRLVEADFCLSADGRVVCYHEVEDKLGLKRPLAEVSYADFMARRFAGKYTPIDLEGLLRLFADQPGMRLVTDTKNANREVLPRLIAAAERLGPGLLPRMLAQAYSRDDVEYVRGLGRFAGVIFTCYLCKYADDELVELARSREIVMMAMFTHRYNARLKERLHETPCGVYVHTVNDPGDVAAYRSQGVGVYTDFHAP